MGTETATLTTTEPRLAFAAPGSLLAALRLGSAALPIGAFAYSQALEQAVLTGSVSDRASAAGWIGGVLEHGLVTLDLPVLVRLHAAFAADQVDELARWNVWLFATRGSDELRAEERQLGRSLLRWLERLGHAAPPSLPAPTTLALAFAVAAHRFAIGSEAAALSYGFAWCEAQVGAATRLVPLGQSDAQLVLSDALERLASGFARALTLEDDRLGATTPGQALLSAAHETQYSRLFRS